MSIKHLLLTVALAGSVFSAAVAGTIPVAFIDANKVADIAIRARNVSLPNDAAKQYLDSLLTDEVKQQFAKMWQDASDVKYERLGDARIEQSPDGGVIVYADFKDHFNPAKVGWVKVVLRSGHDGSVSIAEAAYFQKGY